MTAKSAGKQSGIDNPLLQSRTNLGSKQESPSKGRKSQYVAENLKEDFWQPVKNSQ